MATLFDPCTLGALQLSNRIVMAPMTRSRANNDGTPTDMMMDYYRQRASAGLIIAEGTYPSEDGKGYCRTPGIVNESHIAGWKKITDAVHAEGGSIVLQIMHCGRCSHEENKSTSAETVAPSAISADGEVFTEEGMKPFSEPRALRNDEIADVIEDYRQSTINAYTAGFDGVELHATSGYLPAQFLSPGSNQRNDQYGGSLENRIRFVKEVLEVMCSVKGGERVGMKICPGFPFNDIKDPNAQETFEALLNAVKPLELAYLHIMRASPLDLIAMSKKHFGGPCIINGGFDQNSASQAINSEQAMAVSFGNHYIANPDLVNRFQKNVKLAEPDFNTIYVPSEQGYSNYPAFEEK